MTRISGKKFSRKEWEPSRAWKKWVKDKLPNKIKVALSKGKHKNST